MQPENTQQPENLEQPTETPELVETAPAAAPTPLPESTAIPVATPIKVVKNGPRQRHFLAAFFISFMWGVFGADRMYMGYWGLGILKLITFGGLGIWVVVDLILIMGGYMRDKQGREMLQVAEYKKFANRTVIIFAVCFGVFILITGVEIIAAVSQVMSGLQSGNLPGLSPDLQQELNSANL
jgi:TM2 domain-containing membrane protein YozV